MRRTLTAPPVGGQRLSYSDATQIQGGYGSGLTLGNLWGLSSSPMTRNALDRLRGTRPGDLVCSTAIRLTKEEADVLTDLAHRAGCSRAALMRELVRDGLKTLLEA
jgi:hypothetical protein